MTSTENLRLFYRTSLTCTCKSHMLYTMQILMMTYSSFYQSQSETNGRVRLLISTTAFGMSIDCKSLYQVIHFHPPSDIDYYCQDTGRRRRDGTQSEACLVVPTRSLAGAIISRMEIPAEDKSFESVLDFISRPQIGYTTLIVICALLCASARAASKLHSHPN